MGPSPPPPKEKGGGGRASRIFCPFLLWPNGWMHQDATWYGCRPLPRGLCVRWRPSPLPKKGTEPPNFRPMFIVAKRLDGSLGPKVGLNPGDGVRWGPTSPPPKGRSPQFSAHICCSQMAAWIKMSLGVELDLVSGDFVLDGDPAPLPQKGAEPTSPIFCPFLLWPNCWMHQDATSYGGRPHPGHVVLDRDQLPLKKGAHPPIFGPCLLWSNG